MITDFQINNGLRDAMIQLHNSYKSIDFLSQKYLAKDPEDDRESWGFGKYPTSLLASASKVLWEQWTPQLRVRKVSDKFWRIERTSDSTGINPKFHFVGVKGKLVVLEGLEELDIFYASDKRHSKGAFDFHCGITGYEIKIQGDQHWDDALKRRIPRIREYLIGLQEKYGRTYHQMQIAEVELGAMLSPRYERED